MANVTDFGDYSQRLKAVFGEGYTPSDTGVSGPFAKSDLATITGEIAASRFDGDLTERLSIFGAAVTITVASILSWVAIAAVFAVLV
mgnify:CR=1 FL=1